MKYIASDHEINVYWVCCIGRFGIYENSLNTTFNNKMEHTVLIKNFTQMNGDSEKRETRVEIRSF